MTPNHFKSSVRVSALAVALASAALCLFNSGVAQAQSTIRSPGDRPQDQFELEPHLLLTPFDAPSDPSSGGYGIGLRGTIELAPDGFIPSLNDSVGIGFGLDWVHYSGVGGRGYCRRFEPTVNGVPVCVETSGQSTSYVFIPVVMQWNFWLHRRWSVFGEPGLALYRPSEGSVGVTPVIDFGGRYHISDQVALTLRLGYPSFSAGVSFLF